MARTSKIIIAKNIRVDKEHKEVLNYTEQQMLSLVESNQVASALDYSFIRDKGTISTNFTYNQALQSNYMAFQNKDYSNKWFFAFIDDVKYVNDGVTEISYTIDSWATWFDKVNIGRSFVIREHVNDDSVGLHTLPEDLETGEYIINSLGRIDDEDELTNTLICMGVSWTPDNIPNYTDSREYGGTYSGLSYYLFSDSASCSKMCKAYDDLAKADAIYTIFLVPISLCENLNWYTFNLGNQSDIVASFPASSTFSNTIISNKEITSPTTLNGYSPKNNKLKCYPFNYLYISNNNGIDVTYNYEDFVNNTPKFNVDGVITTGASIRLYPINYKKFNAENYAKMESPFGISGGKYPTCSWNSDPYTNWLTQNAVNISLSVAQQAISTGASILTGNILGAASGSIGIAQSINQVFVHSLIPEQAKGNINTGDVIRGMRLNSFTYYKMSVKEEYARIIDDYFTRYGYKINRLKVPNITGRRYWNYIQISNEDTLGSGEVPQSFMDEINNIARKGTTIWHNHNDIGNYSLNNTII